MMEYEVRLLPDDECILFVRGELPLRDKKWFPWEHEEYKVAREYSKNALASALRKNEPTDESPLGHNYTTAGLIEKSVKGQSKIQSDGSLKNQSASMYKFLSDRSLDYLRKTCDNLTEVSMSPLDFMTLDLDYLENTTEKYAPTDSKTPSGIKKSAPHPIDTKRLSEIIEKRKAAHLTEARATLSRDFDRMTILDIYATPILSETRRDVITRLLRLRTSGHPITDDEIKSIIHPKYGDDEVVKRAELWETVTNSISP